jgi:hypothetical protein
LSLHRQDDNRENRLWQDLATLQSQRQSAALSTASVASLRATTGPARNDQIETPGFVFEGAK